MNNALRSFEGGGNTMTVNPKNGFDLFVCHHHGHRVTSYECNRFYDAEICPISCEKHAALAEGKPVIDEVPLPSFLKRKPKKKQAIEIPETPVMETETPWDGKLHPAGKPYGGKIIYYSQTPGGPVTHRKCCRCQEVKARREFYRGRQQASGMLALCIACCKVRDAARSKRVTAEADPAPESVEPPEQSPDYAPLIRPTRRPGLFSRIIETIINMAA